MSQSNKSILPTRQTFLKDVLGMPKKDIVWVPGKAVSAKELEHEFTDKVYSMRNALLPPSGDFAFCLEEELDSIISTTPQIVVKYPTSEVFARKAQYYIVRAQNRYVTWRDVLHSLENNKGLLEDYTDHRFIEGLCADTDVQYVLHCGS
jgi:hypothetical protein